MKTKSLAAITTRSAPSLQDALQKCLCHLQRGWHAEALVQGQYLSLQTLAHTHSIISHALTYDESMAPTSSASFAVEVTSSSLPIRVPAPSSVHSINVGMQPTLNRGSVLQAAIKCAYVYFRGTGRATRVRGFTRWAGVQTSTLPHATRSYQHFTWMMHTQSPERVCRGFPGCRDICHTHLKQRSFGSSRNFTHRWCCFSAVWTPGRCIIQEC
jgi:hypothetical protein